jgi:16S rRNA (cytosine1402-N4)-methyltransferase
MTAAPHIPVLLSEVLAALSPRDGAIVVDGTFGAGGYARAILGAANCRVYGIDRDPTAIAAGQDEVAAHGGRLTLILGCFGDMDRLMAERGVAAVDGVALDLGVSSMQIDRAERGFSFQKDGPLDMRMGDQGPTAADLVNGLAETELADILYTYGEERHSRRVARAIVARRQTQPFERTGDLADIVRRHVPRSKDGIDPATRAFQALRIAVNDELGEVGRGLAAAERLLSPGGRLAVVSFHSLEDRVVKQFLGARGGVAARPSRHLPEPAFRAPSFRVLAKKPVPPSEAERAANPRARSARLRTAERTTAPAWADDGGAR